jgi:signal transduction histidine kinase
VTTPAPSADALLIRANKLDLLERLADDLAHEIKNPLHSMVINLEVLKRRLARAGEPDEVLRYIGVLGGELERVNRRIELLLRLSRPGRGPEAATLNELVEELMELVQLEARRRQVTVEYDPGNRITRVRVARAATRQVILNLVLEVLAGLDEGGTLRMALSEQEGRAVLTVAGPGVDFPDPAAVVSGDAATPYAVARALAEAVGGSVEPLPDCDDGTGPAAGGAVFSLPVERA